MLGEAQLTTGPRPQDGDHNTARRWTGPLPQRVIYPLIGLLLSLIAPLGLLVLRWLASGEPLALNWLVDDVAGLRLTYGYVTFGAMLGFVTLGYYLGRNGDRLRSEAFTDELTGLFNRRHFEHCLATEMARAKRRNDELSLLVIDVDHLKRINDRAGHRGGDHALRYVGKNLLTDSRATDVVARIGGDEFAILAPHTTNQAAFLLAERLREQIKQRTPKGQAVTVSIGIADLSSLGDDEAKHTGSSLLDAADRALYVAKRRGRDRSAVV